MSPHLHLGAVSSNQFSLSQCFLHFLKIASMVLSFGDLIWSAGHFFQDQAQCNLTQRPAKGRRSDSDPEGL